MRFVLVGSGVNGLNRLKTLSSLTGSDPRVTCSGWPGWSPRQILPCTNDEKLKRTEAATWMDGEDYLISPLVLVVALNGPGNT